MEEEQNQPQEDLSKSLSQNLNQKQNQEKEKKGAFSQIWNKLTSGYRKKKERERLVEEIELNSLSSLTHTRIKQLAKKYPKAAEELARRRKEKLENEIKEEAFSHTFEYHKLKKLENEVDPKPMGGGKVAQFYKWLDEQDTKRKKFYKWLDEKQKKVDEFQKGGEK